MIKIAFVIDSLGIGGTEKSLVELINALSESQFEITIFTLKSGNEIVDQIQRYVTIIPQVSNVNAAQVLINSIHEKKVIRVLQLGKAIFFIKALRFLRLEKTHLFRKASVKLMMQREDEFDYAIFYALPISIGIYFTRMNITARKYYAWVHMDVCAYPKAAITAMNRIYRQYDKFFCVSEYCRESFLKMFPVMKEQTEVFYNIMNYSEIRRLSELPPEISMSNKKTILFTCARVSHEKRPDWAIEIAKKLKENGLDYIWFWAGEGPMKEIIQEEIENVKLNDNFVLMGNLKNPYPYFKCCDAYIQLSEHESYCLSLAEAAVLSKRIVSTDFPTAYEITREHSNCRIVHTQEKIVASIMELLEKDVAENDGKILTDSMNCGKIDQLFL